MTGWKMSEHGVEDSKITVIKRSLENKGGTTWDVVCECGTKFSALSTNLRNGKTKSCGCDRRKKKHFYNLEGKSGRELGIANSMVTFIDCFYDQNRKKWIWNCLCDCGKKFQTEAYDIMSGCKISCGCKTNSDIYRGVDLSGKRVSEISNRYSLLTFKQPIDKSKPDGKYIARCDCGNEIVKKKCSILSGMSSCGCKRTNKEISKPNKIQLIGKHLGKDLGVKNSRLYVKKFAFMKDGCNFYECLCDCGKNTTVKGSSARNGSILSCGCLAKEIQTTVNRVKYAGKRYGMLTVVEDLDEKDEFGKYLVKCVCDCGNECIFPAGRLVSGIRKTCGCSISSGEKNISKILKENNFKFVEQKSFRDLYVYSVQNCLKFDFFVNDEYIIEYDGEQHYSTEKRFHKEPTMMISAIYRDFLKNIYCFEKNIPLIRIPFCIDDITKEILTNNSKFLMKHPFDYEETMKMLKEERFNEFKKIVDEISCLYIEDKEKCKKYLKKMIKKYNKKHSD